MTRFKHIYGLLTALFLLSGTISAQKVERSLEAIDYLQTNDKLIYQNIHIPVLDISYHEFSADSTTWRKNYVAGDKYVRFANTTSNTTNPYTNKQGYHDSWWVLNLTTLGTGTSKIDTLIYYNNGTRDTITSGTATISIPAPQTITGTTTNAQTDTTHTHNIVLTVGDLANTDTTGIADSKILKWNNTTKKWVIADDLTGGGGSSLRVKEQDGSPTVDNTTEIRVANGRLIDEGSGAVSIDFTLNPIDGKQDFYRTDTVHTSTGGDVTITFDSALPDANYIVDNAYALYSNGERQDLSYDNVTTTGFRVLDVVGESDIHYLVMRNLDSLGLAISEVDDKMEWKNIWTQQSYLKNDVVYDEGYVMVANKQTTDRAAPQPVGEEAYLYDTVLTSVTATAKQVVLGSQYTSTTPYIVNGYRVYVVAGNNYEIITVSDPDGANEAQFVNNFTATVSGWREFSLVPRVIDGGVKFRLLSIVSEPDPTPTLDTFNYDYQKPTNATAPTSGQITHASKVLGVININDIDNDATDRSAVLGALGIGDNVTINGTKYAIQSSTDNSTYYSFGVAPARQASGTGVTGVVFETLSGTTITYGVDSSYWAGNVNIKGAFATDVSWESAVLDSSQYIIDLLVQELEYSTDWDLVVAPNKVSTTANSITTEEDVYMVTDGTTSQTLRENLGHISIGHIDTGGDITDVGNDSISISEATVSIKTTNSPDGVFEEVTVPTKKIHIPQNQNYIVYVDYNSGSPQFSAMVSVAGFFYQNWDKLPFATTVNLGNRIIVRNFKSESINATFKSILSQLNYEPVRYLGGLGVADQTGRKFSVAVGAALFGTEYTLIMPINTNATDTFTRMYYNGSWQRTLGESIVDNTQYNDTATGLVSLSNDKYANKWLYFVDDAPSFWVILEGQSQYTSFTEAFEKTKPDFLPPELNAFYAGAILVGKFIVQQGDAEFVRIQSPFEDNYGVPPQSISRSYSFTSQGVGAGTYYIGGYYDFSTTDANLTQAATTQAFGTANVSYASHPFVVAGGAGTVDAGVVGLRVTGTRIQDDGTRTVNYADTIITDITSQALNQYTEAAKFIGSVNYELIVISGTPTTYSYDFNYGLAKYDDFGNVDFDLINFESVGVAGANDANFNITLIHHNDQGWTYAATGFDVTPTVVADLQTTHNTEYQLASGDPFAFKVSPIGYNTTINGALNEGILIRVVTNANNSVQSLDAYVGVRGVE